MAVKPVILSKETIKPSSPTPDHLRDFKLSLLDQLFPPSFYVSIALFYSASDFSHLNTDFETISKKLKASLSNVLTLYYPFCGRLKGNSSVECNDEGVLYVESKVPTDLSNILNNPQVHEIIELFPFDPYNPGGAHLNMAVQLNEFRCGGIGLCVRFSHKIADGATAASFLNAWAATARGHGNIVASPHMEAALVFPPRDNIVLDLTPGIGIVGHDNVVTRRFIFNKANLSKLRDKFECFNPTRVEAVTTLIWKSAMEAAKASSKECTLDASMVTHAVNIRNRTNPPLSEHTFGNLFQQALSPLVKMEGEVELLDLVKVVRKTVRGVDGDYVQKLQGGDGFVGVIQSLKEAMILVAQRGIPCYSFSSWTRFGFYELDFGWGKPSWACSVGAPIKNVVILMATRDGDGIEAWVNLTQSDMAEFENNLELLQFTS